MPSASLAWLRSQGSDVAFRCRWCVHYTSLDIDDAIARFGPETTLQQIERRLVCRNQVRNGGVCNKRDGIAEPTLRNAVRGGLGDQPSEREARLAELAERDRARKNRPPAGAEGRGSVGRSSA